jgi:alkylhydroperoxidase family enzyme
LTEDQMRYLTADQLPEGVYTPAEAAIVRYARKSTRLEPIDDVLYAQLAKHFSEQQLIDICLTVGLSNLVNRFHATFHTNLDGETVAAAETGASAHGACPLPRPTPPT